MQAYLDDLLSRKEADDLEFKSAAGGFPSSFWDTYSSFANTDGGTIVLGVSEKRDGLYLDNLSDKLIDKYQKDFWNNVNNRSTISSNLVTSNDVIVGEYKGYKMLLFYVPRATAEQRPVFRTTNPYNGTFKRNYEGDYKCTQKEVQRMFADADYANNPEDSRILCGYSMDDLDMESLQQYRRLFYAANPTNPWLRLDDMQLLKKLGGYRKDRRTGNEGFTLAGLLMFGKTEAITDNECAPDFFPDYRECLTDDLDMRWTNRICPDGTWEANLFQFYLKILPRLQAVLPKPFKLKNNIRVESTPAHIAIREALINLCVHADYSENASLVVIHEKNKFVFSNPGTMLISKEQYYQGGDSVCRNKSLQKMFMMLGVAEKAGGGADKIISGWKQSNWRSPVIEEKVQPDKVVLTMPMVSLIDKDTMDELKSIFGKEIQNIHNQQTIRILSLACSEGFVTNEKLRYSFNINKHEISDILKDLCEEGLLTSLGHGRGTKYLLPNKDNNAQRSLFDNTKVASSKPNMTSSGANMTSSDPNMTSSDPNMTSSGANMTSSDPNMTSSGANMTSSIKKKMRYEDLEKLIMKICLDWMPIDEIAENTKRNARYIKSYILPKMIANGKIEMLYPGIPTHPYQKYKAKKQEL